MGVPPNQSMSMKLSQARYTGQSWSDFTDTPGFAPGRAQLVFGFGERHLLESAPVYESLRERFPAAAIVLNSTSGEIYQNRVWDDSVVVTAVEFDHTTVRAHQFDIADHRESAHVGASIARALDAPDLVAVFLISDGGRVNGTDLTAALNRALGRPVPTSGGLAGDAARFEKTLVGLNQTPVAGKVVGIGLYGSRLRVGHGSRGGWDVFGPEREVTRSAYNTLYQLGDQQALDLYKEYLGEYAAGLPSAALLFPLALRTSPDSPPLVRTILTIDEAERSMTFAGSLPEGATVRFMTANFDRLIEASAAAAETAHETLGQAPELAILVSCVGRKLVLGERIDEEVEVAREGFGAQTVLTGFYSYGEISPHTPGADCELHNQTMTITVLAEH
jgi:hypothetical protein